jgi:metallo-beta-lactamase class B
MMIKSVFEILMMIAMGLPQLPPPRDQPIQTVPVEPFKVVSNIYFVGPESEHSSFLITTPQGHILINTGFDRQVPTIQASIEKLGFKMTDIKIILGSHAHVDHQEGDARMKEITGAQVMVMAEDVADLKKIKPKETGKEHPIDRIFHDKDTIELGGVTITAVLTPGHTPGCTTYMWKTQDAGKNLDVVFGCGYGAGGRKLVNNKDYPTVIEDYKKTYKVAKTMRADVFLGSHGNHWGLMDKLSRVGKGGNPFIDATTLPRHVEAYEKEFEAELAKQQAASGAN